MKTVQFYSGILGMLMVLSSYSCKKAAVLDDEGQTKKLSAKDLNKLSAVPLDIVGVSSTALFEDEFTITTPGLGYDNQKWFARVGSMAKFGDKSKNLESNLNSTVDGVLEINYNPVDETTNTYSGGGLISRKAMGYGYYEAR